VGERLFQWPIAVEREMALALPAASKRQTHPLGDVSTAFAAVFDGHLALLTCRCRHTTAVSAQYNLSVESNQNVQSNRQSVESKVGKLGMRLAKLSQFHGDSRVL